MAYRNFQSSKLRRSSDCVIRAIQVTTGLSWEEVFDKLTVLCKKYYDVPNSKNIYDRWFLNNGYVKVKVEKILVGGSWILPTVEEFAMEHPEGSYIVSISGHVVGIVDGDYYDSWDCGLYKVRGCYKKVK